MADGPQRPLRGTPLKRFHRDQRRALRDRRRLVLVAENVAYPVNVGSLVRVADGVGAELVLCGACADPESPAAAKVARGKQQRVPLRREDHAHDVVNQLRSEGLRALAVEITADAERYDRVAWADEVALVVGNEDHGVTRQTLAACDGAVFVPMLGRGRSLNVHVAAAVVAYRALLAPVPSKPST